MALTGFFDCRSWSTTYLLVRKSLRCPKIVRRRSCSRLRSTTPTITVRFSVRWLNIIYNTHCCAQTAIGAKRTTTRIRTRRRVRAWAVLSAFSAASSSGAKTVASPVRIELFSIVWHVPSFLHRLQKLSPIFIDWLIEKTAQNRFFSSTIYIVTFYTLDSIGLEKSFVLCRWFSWSGLIVFIARKVYYKWNKSSVIMQ